MNHLENTKIALRRWLTIPDKNVAPRLDSWRVGLKTKEYDCGTIACFGGWIPAMPEFAEMGIIHDENCVPVWPGKTDSPQGLSIRLFGVSQWEWLGLFSAVGRNKYDPKNCDEITSHAVVTHRLKSHIKFLEAQK